MTDLVSVIVPIYKVEKYLSKCIESIITQTYSNLDIVLVDDGSPDNCANICDDYALKDSRIKVFHKENGGLSSARNAGVDLAKGEYITFIDSDDYIDPVCIEVLLDLIKNFNSDISCINARNVNQEGKILFSDSGDKIIEYSSESFLINITNRKILESAWGKLFKADLVREKKFAVGTLNEDFLFFGELLIENKDLRIVFSQHVYYNYLIREKSITNSGFGKSLKDAVNNCLYLKVKAHNEWQDIEKFFSAYACYQAKNCIITMTNKQYNEDKELVCFYKKVIKENYRYTKRYNMTKKDRIFCILFILFPRFTKRITNLVRGMK